MSLVTVRSSNIKTLDYNAKDKSLDVVFASGGSYRYTSISQDVYDALITENEKVVAGDTTASVGSLFIRTVRETSSFSKL